MEGAVEGESWDFARSARAEEPASADVREHHVSVELIGSLRWERCLLPMEPPGVWGVDRAAVDERDRNV